MHMKCESASLQHAAVIIDAVGILQSQCSNFPRSNPEHPYVRTNNRSDQLKVTPTRGLTHLFPFFFLAARISTYNAGLMPFFRSLCISLTLKPEVSVVSLPYFLQPLFL